MKINRQWLLAKRPQGMLSLEDFEYREAPIPTPDLAAGDLLLRNLWFSFDPAQRGWMDDRNSYLPPVALGAPMRATAVAQVVASETQQFPVGSLVQGLFDWQDYTLIRRDNPMQPHPIPAGTPPNYPLSIFGATSLTAYFGILDIGQIKAGDTVVVSGAAGAVGSVAAQIARIKGCRVIGIAGGIDKCQWLVNECKLDAAIDYKNEDLNQKLSALCPAGIDVFFDNVGGGTLEVLLEHMSDHGRIVNCGQISQYNAEQPAPGPCNLNRITERRLRMQGFILMDFIDRIEEAMNDITPWVMGGELAFREDVKEGFENIPATLLRLYTGQNQGKQLLKVCDPTES